MPFSRGLSRFTLLLLFSDIPPFSPDFNGFTVKSTVNLKEAEAAPMCFLLSWILIDFTLFTRSV